MKTYILCFSTIILGFILFQCTPEKAKSNTNNKETAAKEAKSAIPDDGVIRFIPAPPSVASYGFASIHDLVYKENIMSFTVGLGGYALGAPTSVKADRNQRTDPNGQYYNLYLNGGEPSRYYNDSLNLPLKDGMHEVIAVINRSDEESVKGERGYVSEIHHIRDGAVATKRSISTPRILYNAPSGEYKGKDAENILLDFYLINCNLEGDFRVKVNIDDQVRHIDTWTAYYITGLKPGKHKIRLTLTNNAGEIIDTKYNPVVGEFTIVE